ncbi:hypothetical protein [Bacillus gobiensis]|uniref:Uncharacterized protein n=1 Tax=Bacillus gobiensis TaxID=1441095 RepID=A0A0M4FQQ1_9BACI|nr:hypothetical protein [Bacillus gobiensis]ALC81559.1 hypothetical protein AM592_08065 [Bacillus gobiensis]
MNKIEWISDENQPEVITVPYIIRPSELDSEGCRTTEEVLHFGDGLVLKADCEYVQLLIMHRNADGSYELGDKETELFCFSIRAQEDPDLLCLSTMTFIEAMKYFSELEGTVLPETIEEAV